MDESPPYRMFPHVCTVPSCLRYAKAPSVRKSLVSISALGVYEPGHGRGVLIKVEGGGGGGGGFGGGDGGGEGFGGGDGGGGGFGGGEGGGG